MPEINLAYLELRLSGGTTNSHPHLSLGGVRSDQRILSKAATALTQITGVVIDDAPGTADGAGSLSFNATARHLTWTPYGGTAGSEVLLLEEGRYAIPGSSGYLLVTVTLADLPATSKTETVVISQRSNRLWDNIKKTESYDGNTEYRCCYLYNAHPEEPFIGTKLYIGSQPNGADDLFVGLDPIGTGDGLITGVAGVIVNEDTAPTNVAFYAPSAISDALFIGQLDPGQCRALWEKRVVPPLTLVSTSVDVSSLVFNVGY